MSADQEIVKDILDDAGIPCMVRNEHLAMAFGELVSSHCSPEIWILNDEDYARANEIVNALRTANAETYDAWTCSGCREAIEGQFTSCWKCGKDRPQAK